MSREKTKCITSIGGQALVEGVMMRGPEKTELAVRLPDGTISLEQMKTAELRQSSGHIWQLPFFRGMVAFVDSLTTGYRAMMRSVEKAGLEEEEESKLERWADEKFGNKAMNAVSAVGTVLGFVIAVALFFVLPTWLFNLLQRAAGPALAVWRSPAEGVMRIGIFIAYLAACAAMPDMHRVFQYHGAEHKTIFCYENGEELTVENVRKHQRFHPRCGTSFFALMLLIGILIGFLIPFTDPFIRTLAKLACIPIVVGCGYELLRYCGRNDNLLTHIISAPGLWVQRLTTKEPDDNMIGVAIAAMREVIPENGEDRIEIAGKTE